MFIKLANQFEKILFTLVFFLLTDKFAPFMGFLSSKPYIKNLIRPVTGVNLTNIGKAVLVWSEAIFAIYIEAAFWLVLLLLLVRRGLFAKILKMIWNNIGIAALLMLAFASWFWSVLPSNTLSGAYFVLEISLLGVYISQRYSPEEILEMFITVITFASIFSIFAILQWPEKSIQLGGEWQGIYTYKNELGRLMAFGNIMLVVYWFKNHTLLKRIFTLIIFLLTGILLVFSRSTTSILILLVIYGSFIIYGIWTSKALQLNIFVRRMLIVLGIIVVISIIWRMGIIEKTPSLTGRVVLWGILWDWIQIHPILGVGYEAFWGQFPEGISLSASIEFDARHAHNGYIDVLLSLGFVGLILFVFSLGLALKRAFVFFKQKGGIVSLWPLLALIYLILSNITYSVAFGFPDFHWMLFVIVAGVVTSTEVNPVILKQDDQTSNDLNGAIV